MTMRSDFLPRVASFPSLNDVVSTHMMHVGAMSDAELCEAIEQPAFLCGAEPQIGLTEVLLDEVHGQAGALALLEFTLDQLWETRQGGKLTHEAYRELGGVKGAVKKRADAILAGLSSEEQKVARRLFVDLVQLVEGAGDIKRRVPFEKFRDAHGPNPGLLRQVLLQLQNARLITTSQDGRFYEVAHEALIREWPALEGWLKSERADELVRRRLVEAAAEWQQHGRDEGYLLRGNQLDVMREWAEAHGDCARSSRA